MADAIDLQINVERRVRELRLRNRVGDREVAPRRTANPLREWLAWHSYVPVDEIPLGAVAHALVEAERLERDPNMHALIRRARAELGSMPPVIDWNVGVEEDDAILYETEGAGIKASFAAPPGPSGRRYLQAGQWLYPVWWPGRPQYHRQVWHGDVGAGKTQFSGYDVTGLGVGLCAEGQEHLFAVTGGSGWGWWGIAEGDLVDGLHEDVGAPAPADGFFYGLLGGFDNGYGRGAASYYSIVSNPDPPHETIGRELQFIIPGYAEDVLPPVRAELFRAAPGELPVLETLQVLGLGTAPSAAPAPTGDPFAPYEEPVIDVPYAAVWFPADRLYSGAPIPVATPGVAIAGDVHRDGVDWETPSYDELPEDVELASGDLLAWVESHTAGVASFDRDDWVQMPVSGNVAPVWAAVRYGWVRYRGEIFVQGSSVSVTAPAGAGPENALSWTLAGRRGDTPRTFAAISGAGSFEVLDVQPGDVIDSSGVSWAVDT